MLFIKKIIISVMLVALVIGCISIASGIFGRGDVVVAASKFGGTNYSCCDYPLNTIQNSEASDYVNHNTIFISGADENSYGVVYVNAGSAWGTTDFVFSDYSYVTIDFDISAADASDWSPSGYGMINSVPDFNFYLVGRTADHKAVTIEGSNLFVSGQGIVDVSNGEIPLFDIIPTRNQSARVNDLSLARITYVFRVGDESIDMLIFINNELAVVANNVVSSDISYFEGIRFNNFYNSSGAFVVKNLTVNTFAPEYKGPISRLCDKAFSDTDMDTVTLNGCADIKRFVRG